jgi:plasmid stabilization system protein ParE
MAKWTVKWTRTADIQFVGILDYWVKRTKSTAYSKKLINLVSEKTLEIAKSPFLYKFTDFKDTRVALVGNFSIYYKVEDQEIIITAFWDNRQDPKRLIEALKEAK